MDVISRQAAIDEFCSMCDRWDCSTDTCARAKFLRDLPSVQPKADEWCTDCPAYDHEKHNCPRYNRVIREAVKEIKPERKSVIYYGDVYSDGCTVHDTAECPSCGYIFDEEDSVWKEPFCPHCGQELEW